MALRDRLNEAHMLAGVTIVDPLTTWIDPAVTIEPDATIERSRSSVAPRRWRPARDVGPHAVAVDAEIGPDVLVGPFCYLRPGTVLAAGSKAGTFVEIKNSRIGERTKVPHLSYIGDAEVGEDTNIAAGSITVNFPHEPGRPKGRTTIGSNVRTGVDNAFVAPVTIGDDAWIAAGSVITEDVPRARSQSRARGRRTRKGVVESGTIEQTLPGLDARGGARGDEHRTRHPADSPEAVDGLRGSLARRAGAEDRRKPRRRARRGRAATRSRTGRRIAATMESIRGADIFILQTGCDPVDRNLMELLFMIQAAKLASAKRITAVDAALPVRPPGSQGEATRADLQLGSWPTCSSSRAPIAC